MSATVLEHPLVRDYLRRLAAACAALPPTRARELREQIVAHLDEALPPGAADAEVAAELARLGAPAALAAEAGGPDPRPPGVRLLSRLARVGWRTWTSIAVTVALLAATLTYVISVQTAPSLSGGGMFALWFRQDAARGVWTTTVEGSQMSVPERLHQRQGFLIGISNDSDWTQTIEGVGADYSDLLGLPMTVAVGVGPGDSWGAYTDQTRWVLPASVPPHSSRVLRVLWTSNLCLQPGSDLGFTDVSLRVRVGLFTRTEHVPFNNLAFVMTGTKACH